MRVSVTGLPEGAPSPTSAAVQELSHLLPALWRGLTRATRAADRMPAVESQVSILRLLVGGGERTPAQLADELRVARATVSNLLKPLESAGMVRRRPSEVDGRSVVVLATDQGREVLEGFRQGRAVVLADALGSLDPHDREQILRALPSFARLLESLDARSAT